MIRHGEERDIEPIVAMACEFWAHTTYKDPACPETIRGMVSLCINDHLMSVIEINNDLVGFAAGLTGPLLGNGLVLTGTELAWWVNPAHRSGSNGVKLLKHIEQSAKDAGVTYWSMAYMESSMPEAIKGIYEKMGYQRTEITYMKRL